MCFSYFHHTEDWKCDHYRWINKGVTPLPDESPKLSKYYYHIDTPDGSNSNFKRHAYKLIDAPKNLVLVHYIGDDKVAVDFPHKSATKLQSNFVRTLPSYLKSLEKKVAEEKASIVYKKEVAQIKDNGLIPIALPQEMCSNCETCDSSRPKKSVYPVILFIICMSLPMEYLVLYTK